MSLLSYIQLIELVNRDIIQNSNPDMVNSASIDIRLGPTFLRERPNNFREPFIVELDKKHRLNTERVECVEEDDCIVLAPGEFILAQSMEVFNLPRTISAEYKLKSSMARIGLEHLNAGWCDAGWHGSVLTLELKNMTRYHHIILKPGNRIGQMVFFEHAEVPEDKSYGVRGSYNNDLTATGVKVK